MGVQLILRSYFRKIWFIILVFVFVVFLSYGFIHQKGLENEEMIQRLRFQFENSTVPLDKYESMKNLYKKLITLEYENNNRTQQLLTLFLKLKRTFSADLTEGETLSVPSIHNSLPHLLRYKNALTPGRRLSKNRRNVSLSFGIPTVRRQNKSYLIQTLQSMINGLSDREKLDVLIIIFIGEKKESSIMKIISIVKERFQDSLDSGLLEIVVPASHFYPDFDSLPSTFGDSKERVRWRAKQNLDYAFLMMYARSRAIFYVQMEDDILATPSYASTMKAFAMQQASKNWFMLEFCSLGFIGKLFRSSDLHIFIEFLLMFFKEKPNDWLLDHVFWVKVCNPEKSEKECIREKEKLRIKFKPSLFQHIGKESSLKGKKQDLVDKDFKNPALFLAHLNPPAKVRTTNLQEYKTYSALRGYLGHTFFWASTSTKNSNIRITFHKPQALKSFLFRSGNVEHPGDILINATVEVLTAKSKKALTDEIKDELYPDENYKTIGSFDRNGLAKGNLNKAIGLVDELRIRILEDRKDKWILISEFFIQVR